LASYLHLQQAGEPTAERVVDAGSGQRDRAYETQSTAGYGNLASHTDGRLGCDVP
jgi:hypothetical protein